MAAGAERNLEMFNRFQPRLVPGHAVNTPAVQASAGNGGLEPSCLTYFRHNLLGMADFLPSDTIQHAHIVRRSRSFLKCSVV